MKSRKMKFQEIKDPAIFGTPERFQAPAIMAGNVKK